VVEFRALLLVRCCDITYVAIRVLATAPNTIAYAFERERG